MKLTRRWATIALDDIGDTLEPYERLIHDAIKGDKGRFTRSDGLRYAWQTVAAARSKTSPT